MPETYPSRRRGMDTASETTLGPPGPAGPPGGQSYVQAIGDGVHQSFVVPHNIGVRGVQVSVYQSTTPYARVEAEVQYTDANTVTVLTTTIPAAGELTVLVSGPGAASGSDANFAFTQAAPAATWNVTHNLGKYPSVAVVDTGGNLLVADVQYVNANSLVITFGSAMSGSAYCN